MKKLIGLVLISVASIALAQKPQKKAVPAKQSALQSMVDTELAFAKMSAEQGTRPAFMAFIDEEGILFRPRAVKGKQWMSENPVPSSDKRPLLSWYPAVADISQAGDLGYTTGPWEYKADIHDAKPVAFGNFLTVWKRQADGSWKFAIDLGISNPPPDKPIPGWQLPKGYRPSRRASEANVPGEQSRLVGENSVFAGRFNLNNASRSFDSVAASDVRLFRNGKAPLVGKVAAAAGLPDGSTVWSWQPSLVYVSRSGDLGFTYGTYRKTSKDASKKLLESGNYYRIWKKQTGKWKLVADLLDPVAEDKKN